MPERGAFRARSFTHLYPLAVRRHMLEVNLDALRRIGVQPEPAERKVEFVPGQDAEKKVRTLVSGAFIHVHPASRWRFKCWSSAKNAELVDRLAADGHQVVITAAPDPEELAFVEEIRAHIRSAPLNLAGQLSIKELGALTARAKLFIGVDSMPMHLAAAMGTPTVVLFGPSGESVWGPVNVAHRVVHSAHSCRPCGLDGCGGGKVSDCIVSLPVNAVHAAARELLAK
jgi:heptosyltransferase-3